MRLVDTPRRAVGAAGLALFAGWAITALSLSLGLVVGVDPTLRNAVLLWLVLIAVAALAALRGPFVSRPRGTLRERGGPPRACALLGAVVLAGYLLALLARSWEPTGILHADVWNQWFAKAKILYFFGGLDTGPGGFTNQFNPDYPPLAPTSEALMFDAIGGAETLELARLHWVLAASFLGAVAWILAARVRPAILWPSLALLALAPKFGSLYNLFPRSPPPSLTPPHRRLLARRRAAGDADRARRSDRAGLAPRRRPPVRLLSGLFLAAATATKNEGLMLALVVVVALAVARPGRHRLRGLAGLAGGIVVVTGIWRIWLNRHSVPRNPFYDLGDILHPGYLWSRNDRLGYALGELLEQLVTPSRWLLLVPATLLLALLAGRQAPTISVFVATVVVLDVLGFAAVYWLSQVDLHFYVDNTVDRLPAFIAVFCGAVFPLLLSVTAPARTALDQGNRPVPGARSK